MYSGFSQVIVQCVARFIRLCNDFSDVGLFSRDVSEVYFLFTQAADADGRVVAVKKSFDAFRTPKDAQRAYREATHAAGCMSSTICVTFVINHFIELCALRNAHFSEISKKSCAFWRRNKAREVFKFR